MVFKLTSFRAYICMAFCVWLINYFRHFSCNWATQQQLHLTHPAIYRKFVKGHFSVKRSRSSFNKLPPDQVIKQTINKEQKVSGGKIEMSTLHRAVQRWILSSPIIARLMANCRVSILQREKILSKIWTKHGLKMMEKLCSIAAASSNVGKIHLSKVKKFSVFHHKWRHHQQFKNIWWMQQQLERVVSKTLSKIELKAIIPGFTRLSRFLNKRLLILWKYLTSTTFLLQISSYNFLL